jgi:hypothetical protein
MFTIAKALLTQSRHLIPWEGAEHMQDSDESSLFYNPAITYILHKLLTDDGVVFKIEDETWYVWYPLEKPVNL